MLYLMTYTGLLSAVSIKFNHQLNLIAQISPINFNWRFRANLIDKRW